MSHLGAHDALHISRPTILGGDHHTGRVAEAGADLHILHIWVCQGPLPPIHHPLELLLHHATDEFGQQLRDTESNTQLLEAFLFDK